MLPNRQTNIQYYYTGATLRNALGTPGKPETGNSKTGNRSRPEKHSRIGIGFGIQVWDKVLGYGFGIRFGIGLGIGTGTGIWDGLGIGIGIGTGPWSLVTIPGHSSQKSGP